MSTLLVVQAHPHVKNSLLLTVGKQFVESYEASHPNDNVIIRDLYAKDGVPPLNDVTMAAWQKQKFDEQLTAEEMSLLQKHEE